MAELGIDISAQRSKAADEFREMDLDRVITVCDQAAKSCPAWLGKGHVKHMGYPDPAAAQGSRSERLDGFRQVRDGLREQVLAYLQQDDDLGTEVFYLATGGL